MFKRLTECLDGVRLLPSNSSLGHGPSASKGAGGFSYVVPEAQQDLFCGWSRTDEYRRLRGLAMYHARCARAVPDAKQIFVISARYWNHRVIDCRRDDAQLPALLRRQAS
jgi:hypothetical protein